MANLQRCCHYLSSNPRTLQSHNPFTHVQYKIALCCTLYVTHCVVHCMWHTVLYTVCDTLWCTLYVTHCAVHCMWHTVLYTVCDTLSFPTAISFPVLSSPIQHVSVKLMELHHGYAEKTVHWNAYGYFVWQQDCKLKIRRTRGWITKCHQQVKHKT
jgi:hypothetical protein